METSSEAVEKANAASEEAHRAIELQRARLAALSQSDLSRPAEEGKLQSMIEAASVADETLITAMDREEVEEQTAPTGSALAFPP